MHALLVENYGLNTKQQCFLIMAVLYRGLSIQSNGFKLVSCKDRKCMHAILVENYGLNTKQRSFLIMAVLYRMLSIENNGFKLVS